LFLVWHSIEQLDYYLMQSVVIPIRQIRLIDAALLLLSMVPLDQQPSRKLKERGAVVRIQGWTKSQGWQQNKMLDVGQQGHVLQTAFIK
jgi:hypothetical protein